MARKGRAASVQLHRDNRGVIWDLLLYVPTVGFLLLWGLKLWAGGEQVGTGYALMFLGFFFLMAGGNRVMRRLQLLPSAPVTLDVDRDRIQIGLRGGETVSLVQDVRFFTDYAGKSFGLSGMDTRGAKRQFVFHRSQFGDERDYEAMIRALDPYRA